MVVLLLLYFVILFIKVQIKCHYKSTSYARLASGGQCLKSTVERKKLILIFFLSYRQTHTQYIENVSWGFFPLKQSIFISQSKMLFDHENFMGYVSVNEEIIELIY